MAANHLLLKLLLAPLIIAGATLIARRWGENIGGLIVGLPLTSGPVSVFFAIEQGQAFAGRAAQGAMLGLIPVAVFCLGYGRSARRLPWYLAAALSIILYVPVVWIMSSVSVNLWTTVIVVAAALALSFWALGEPENGSLHIAPPWWDLPIRMVISAGLLVLITTLAGWLGPKWSGLLSPFPIFTFVMATFAHSQGGPAAAWRMVRGVVAGVFAYLAFFLVIALLIERTSLWVVYPLAAVVALGVNALLLASLLRKQRMAALV